MKKRSNAGLKNDLEILMLAGPALVWYGLFCFLPIFGIVLAFKSYRFIPGQTFIYSLFHSEWVGLENFRFMFLNPQMGKIILNTLGYNLIFLVTDTVLPIAFAIGLSKLASGKFAKFSQTASLLPHFLSWVAVSYFVFGLLSADKGVFNNILRQAGLGGVRWYQKADVWPAILILTHIWKSLGYAALIYKASLAGIDLRQYESAMLDGASSWQITKYITVPYLIPMAITLLILNLGTLFSSSFGLFYQVTRNSETVLREVETIDVYVYKALMEKGNYGYSAAASLLQNICGCILMLISNALIVRYDPERGLFR